MSALIQNAHTCLYGNELSTFFGMDPVSLQEYFSWTIALILALVFRLIEAL